MNQCCIKLDQCQLFDQMRIVWLRHVWWTREVILSIANNLPSTNDSVNKLLQNPAEMMAIFAPYFPQKDKEIKMLTDLFTTHLKLGGDIVTAAKNGDTAKVTILQKQWHENADDIARAFHQMCPCYNYETTRKMMYSHLQLTTDEAIAILQSKFADGIKIFDNVQHEALMMADYFSAGINFKH